MNNSMKWHEVILNTTNEAYEAMSHMLISIGSSGLAIEEVDRQGDEQKRGRFFSLPKQTDEPSPYLQKNRPLVCLRAFFPETKDIKNITKLINEKIATISKYLYTGDTFFDIKEINEEDWAESWKKHYKPIRIAKKAVVKPSWYDYKNRHNRIIIELDPGMAFGTGTHETTRLCAVLLEKYLKKSDRVIDVGCGSGILSILAAKLGADKVVAVDIDETAVKIAKENCTINHVNNKINVSNGELKDIKDTYASVVVANIIADIIIDLKEELQKRLQKDKILIVSGIIKERMQDVIKTFDNKGFEYIEKKEKGEWVAIVFKCTGSL